MGFTIKDNELTVESTKVSKMTAKNYSIAEEKEFYSFLQKLNLRIEMGME